MAADSSCQKVASSFNQSKSKICTHCHTSKTSLWRSGPFGRKSLCNACGLRYRRKGLEAPGLESKEGKGKNMRCMGRIRKYKKENPKNKGPREVDMLMTIDRQDEQMPQQVEQDGDEGVKAATILMDM
ncbi:unnamed protein product [Urochloa humidicola]